MPIGEDASRTTRTRSRSTASRIAQFKEVSGLCAEIQVIEHQENKPKGIPVMKKLPGPRS